MKRSTIRIIIIFSVLLFASLVLTQIFWVTEAKNVRRQQVQYDITSSLKTVAQQIQQMGGDTNLFFDPVVQMKPNLFRVQINDTLQPFFLESLINQQFSKDEINLDYEYAIYDCFTDSVVYQKAVKNTSDPKEASGLAPQLPHDHDGHYFSVFFPTLTSSLWLELDFWWASSIILLVVLIFFAYTISIILKQKKLSEVRADFINNMTHELKTPISTIGLSANVLLKNTEQDERSKQYAQIIENENTRLRTLVERVLQMANSDAGKLELKRENLNLKDMVEDVIGTAKALLPVDQGEIGFHASDNINIYADPVHITNVVSNLLDNAIKYSTPPKQVEVSLSLESGRALLSVKDNGIGIPKKFQRQIFDQFFRVPTGDRHDVKGFGVGLYYVHLIAKAHGGMVRLESDLDAGSTFTLVLPASKSN